MKNEIILYQPNQLTEYIEVRNDEETVWLTQQQMAALFNQTKQNISLHINNCFKEKELEVISVVKDSMTTAKDGKSYKTKYYNQGKKWFAFSKMEKHSVQNILNSILQLL